MVTPAVFKWCGHPGRSTSSTRAEIRLRNLRPPTPGTVTCTTAATVLLVLLVQCEPEEYLVAYQAMMPGPRVQLTVTQAQYFAWLQPVANGVFSCHER
eukprot:3686839-Rhodomonas_salina.2